MLGRTLQRAARTAAVAAAPRRLPRGLPAIAPVSRRALSSASAEPERHGFKAETSKLLDIVTNSIYTDKIIFLRELVSNAADALEKFRHLQTAGDQLDGGDRDLAIRITLNPEAGTLTMEDTGIGMTKDELMDNLGTIARSGSKAFVESQRESGSEAAKNVIGQFGVGFYSAFMVANEVEVFSKPATGGSAHVWRSNGTDDFTIQELPDTELNGTRLVLHLKDADKEDYTNFDIVTSAVKRYSNYVGFPVYVNDKKANEVSAIWARDKSKITEEEYDEFYRFCAHAFDKPLYRLHFQTDVPIDLKALLFIPSQHSEKMGMGRMRPGVSLYSRKVLLDANSEKLLPEWMRFVKGVVDSEDLPISLSRETMQDSRLMQSIRRALTRRVIKLLADEAKKDGEAYNDKFAREFGYFLKQGVCSDYESQADIAKLLRFNSSEVGTDKLTSLDEYISRCAPSQKKIYYLSAPSRELAERSPYYEVFKRNNIEVLFLYNTVDDFVMGNLAKYQGRDLVAAESGDIDVEDTKSADSAKDGDKDGEKLSAEDRQALIDWFGTELKDVVRKVNPSTRLRDSPAIVVDHESAALRRMMRMVQQGEDGANIPLEDLPKQTVELNVEHPIIVSLNDLRNSNPTLASAVARQVFDNAIIAAGLVDDPRAMLPRLTKLLESLLEAKPAKGN